AEDGIRDFHVTGVQTCALPILTNFVLMEYGQPLHAFDYDRFGSKEILVRRARDGETMVTLDDQERKLTEEQLVITNGTEPTALRSEERRVGKECRARWTQEDQK